MTQPIRIRLFARFRDLFGTSILEVPVSGPTTVSNLRTLIAAMHPEAASLLQYSTFAINNEYADDSATVTPADEMALIPPVSGGASSSFQF